MARAAPDLMCMRVANESGRLSPSTCDNIRAPEESNRITSLIGNPSRVQNKRLQCATRPKRRFS